MKNENWQEAISILENLTKQNQSDTDLFYLLGLCYYEVEQYQNAAASLIQTLVLGGTILSEIPSGSAPSNDIMIKIDKAYAKEGDKNNAIFWLKEGFSYRYDEKPFLESSPDFKSLSNDIDFKKLFGDDTQKDITREEAWTRQSF